MSSCLWPKIWAGRAGAPLAVLLINGGKLIVAHHPNITSGGQVSEIEVEAFLARGGHGPEHQALLEALARVDTPNRAEGDQSQHGP